MIAFVVAPLWVPLIAAPAFRLMVWPDPSQTHWVVIATLTSALFAYGGCLLLGQPLHRWLVQRRLVSLWIALAAGLVIGAVSWLIFMVCFALFFGGGVGGVASALSDAPKHLAFLVLPAGLGALVGATIWLIARPDRQAHTAAMMFPPSVSEHVKARAFRAHNGELGILPSDAAAFLQACRSDKVRVWGWELWIVDHQCNFFEKPIPAIGSWCGIVPVPEGDVPVVITGAGDVDETERQIACFDFEAEVAEPWRHYVRVNFLLGD
jgi:hypothetical protein